MSKEMQVLSRDVDAIKTTLQLYTNFCVAWVGQTPMIRTGSIRTASQVRELVALAQTINNSNERGRRPFRLCSNQINSVEFEWNAIERQHQLLMQSVQELRKQDSIVHISTPLEKLLIDRPPEKKLKRVGEALEKLPKLLNMEAWVSYCVWYNELLEEAFSHFLYDAVDEYTLERYVKDFRHEVLSPFLEKTRKRLVELELSMGTGEESRNLSYGERVAMEKELIVVRSDMQRMVRAHFDDLVEILRLISVIESAHPELVALKMRGQLLKQLLVDQVEAPNIDTPSWEMTQMMLQLLNDELGVISIVNCAEGNDRTHFAFAIRLALLQLKKKCSLIDTMDMVFHWEESVREVNKEVVQTNRARLVVQFRENVLENIVNFCLPLTRENTDASTSTWEEGSRENLAFLNVLPSYMKGEALVKYEDDSGDPVGLTEAGQRFMLTLSTKKL